MKKILLISFLSVIAIGLSAQRVTRKNIRQGNKAYNEQRYGAAEEKYKVAIDANAASKEASYNLANTYYKQQRWDEALKEYQHYLTLENDNEGKMSSAWSNIGNTYLKKKANEKGQQQQTIMPGADPQQQQAGGQKQQADNLKMSMEAYKQALRLNPTDNDTRYNLAVVQKMIKDQEDQDKDNQQDKQNKDDKKQEDKKDKEQPKQDPKQYPKQDKKQQDNQMSQDNIQQILQAIEQDEKETQERVKQSKAEERKQQNQNNRKQDKDW